MVWIRDGSLFRDKRFGGIPGIAQFTTTRVEGNLRDPAVRSRFKTRFSFKRWALCEQVHGITVAQVHGSFKGEKIFLNTDSLVTASRGTALGIFTADCVPVFFIDPVKHVIGLVHAGRKGTVSGIVARTVGMLVHVMGCMPNRISVALGPHICRTCYMVDGRFFDLTGKIVKQLVSCGIKRWHIAAASPCTAHGQQNFFSYRKENRTEDRVLSVIGML